MTTLRHANALSLHWTVGFNKDIIDGVHSLADEHRHAIFYVSAHMGVIYDYSTRTQKLLQGHCNAITCCTVSEDKRWIVTVDSGMDCILVVWDSHSGLPIKTLFNPHSNGVVAVDISPDSMFLVTLSKNSKEEDEVQEISLWEWTTERSGPLYTSKIATEDHQTCVKFNPNEISQIVTNGKKRVIFWSWAKRKFEYYSPPLSQKEFKQKVGDFTRSLFVRNSSQVISGTIDGDLIVWDQTMMEHDGSITRAAKTNSIPTTAISTIDKRAIKIIRVSGQEGDLKSAVNFIGEINGYLVVGGSDGTVKFFDSYFRLIAWFEDLQSGPISSISFANIPITHEDENVFQVPHFLVGTRKGFILGMESSLFGSFRPEDRRGTLLVQGIDDQVHGLCAHPKYPYLAFSSYSGQLQLWDYETRRIVKMRNFNSIVPQCLAYCSNGKYLAAGFTNGVLKILDGFSLEDIATFRQSKNAILKVRFSMSSNYLATADIDFHVAIWSFTGMTETKNINEDTSKKTDGEIQPEDQWVYLGRHRSHTKHVTGLEFGIGMEGQDLLVSVGEDKKMVEYNLSKTSISNGVILSGPPILIEQSGTPTSCFWHKQKSDNVVVVANDEYKMKQWNLMNQSCRRTSLGPTYGGPLNRLLHLPGQKIVDENMDQYCVYSTSEKIVGFIKLPLDGNPNKSMGLIAHPGEISDIAISYDGKYLLTAGGSDMTVNMWAIDTYAIDMVEAIGGVGAEPYVGLIEGGYEGEFYNEIVDYFYYAQLRSQGEQSTDPRKIEGRIPFLEVPNMMRALGFYPTELEIRNIMNEIQYVNSFSMNPVDTNEYIDLVGLIKLYVNHRPVFGIGKQHIEQAFQALLPNRKPLLEWHTLKTMLLNEGEVISLQDLRNCMGALVGDPEFHENLDASTFADQVLGFEDYEQENHENTLDIQN